MPVLYQVTYLPEGRREERAGLCNAFYRVEREVVTVESDLVWCPRCGRVTDGEVIPSLEEIHRRIQKLRRLAEVVRQEMIRPPSPAGNAPGDRHQREQIEREQVRLTWRRKRKAPPRCSECGGTEIRALDPGEPLRVGERTIILAVLGLCTTDPQDRYYTAEGERSVDGGEGSAPQRQDLPEG
jgi:ribosomal protein S27AE